MIRPAKAARMGALGLGLCGLIGCGTVEKALLDPGEEPPLDAGESYVAAGGPQTGVDLGEGGEQLLTRYQKVLEKKIALESRVEELESERHALETSSRHEREAKERERGLRVGAEAQRDHLARQLAEREAKILALDLERAKLEQEVLRLRIVAVERQLADLDAAAAAAPAGGDGR